METFTAPSVLTILVCTSTATIFSHSKKGCGFSQCLIKAPLHEPQIEMKLNIHALVVMLLKGKVVVGITVRKCVDFSFFLFVSTAPLSIQRAKGASEEPQGIRVEERDSRR